MTCLFYSNLVEKLTLIVRVRQDGPGAKVKTGGRNGDNLMGKDHGNMGNMGKDHVNM